MSAGNALLRVSTVRFTMPTYRAVPPAVLEQLRKFDTPTICNAFGAVGLITSGAGRDLDQVEALNFPCFTDGTICAHGYCHFVSLNLPVHVGGVMIHQGDLLHGDRNGVTTIPNDIAAAVAQA